jgi:type IV fimbrial biogenesis protein FimT
MGTLRRAAAGEGGFTLLESLVALTVAAVILGLAAPNFVSVIQNNRAATQTNEVVTALNLARNEAVRRSAVILVCSSSTGASCDGDTDWSNGWIVRTLGGELIRVWPEALQRGSVAGDVSEVRFEPRGTAAAEGALAIRIPGCTGEQGRLVSINRAGGIAVRRTPC